MKSVPRILPIVGVAMGGVLAVNALSGAQALPELVSGARAFAEEAIGKGGEGEPDKPETAAEGETAPTGEAADAAAKTTIPKPAQVCAPTAAELAKEAGLSPAELQVLQSLGERRGQLDQREASLDTQLALMAAAETKLDAKVKALNDLKAQIEGLMGEAAEREDAEVARMVKVFEGMKPKDAAARMVVLDDAVRLPIASKMKERSLSAVLAAMPPVEAKKLTESLAKRFAEARALGDALAKTEAAAAQAAAPPAKAAAPPAKAGA
ncbi:MotE family protein [Phenylobacterium sp.]|uniref:MotE family protein n=1 Tax=Phenylobacterium sp. TaxID=1871053 RepID=UPI0035C7DE71